MFYGLTREELKGKRPLAKFLSESIKLIVMFIFYQSFVIPEADEIEIDIKLFALVALVC